MRVAVRIVGALIAVAIMAYLIAQIGVDALTSQLALAGPGFLWVLVMHAAAIVIAALPWWVVLPAAARPSIGGAIGSRVVASGANAVLPLFGLGGELARLFWLRKPDRAGGLAAIIVDRLMYGVASACLLAAGLVGLLHVPQLSADYATVAALGVVGLLVLVAVGCVIALRLGVGARIQRLVRRLRRQVDAGTEFGDAVDASLRGMLRLRSRGPYIAWALHFLARGIIGAEIVLGFYLLDTPLAWDEALVFAALPVVLALAGAIIPSQLGVHEGAQALVATAFGIEASTAVAVVLLMRLRQIASMAVIAPYLLLRRRTATAFAQ